MSVASVHVHYVAKAERKGRTRAEVDQVIRWLTGYSQDQLEALLAAKTDFETFFAEAPAMNPNRFLITGMICGHRVEEIEDPFGADENDLPVGKLVENSARQVRHVLGLA